MVVFVYAHVIFIFKVSFEPALQEVFIVEQKNNFNDYTYMEQYHHVNQIKKLPCKQHAWEKQ